MADTKVSYTVKILGSKEDDDLMYAIFRKMKSLSGFYGELIRTKSDEARQTFEINEDFGRTNAMLIILKVGLLLDRYQRKSISFKVFGVEDNDYGTVIPFLIDGTGQTPTYREMFVDLCDEMEGKKESRILLKMTSKMSLPSQTFVCVSMMKGWKRLKGF